MTIVPVQNYPSISYTHPDVTEGLKTRRWVIIARNPSEQEADENAVLDSHPERRIDGVFPAYIHRGAILVIATVIVPLLLGEQWRSWDVENPAEPLGFDHDAF